MSPRHFFIVAIFCCFSGSALAQKARIYNSGKSMYTQKRFQPPPKVKGSKAKTVCPIFVESKYPYQGFGIKLGDPFALTYKYYANEHFAVAVDVGKASSGLYNSYFKEKFYEYIVTDTFSTAEASIEYYTHKVTSDLMAEAKLLYSIDVQKIAPGLQVYVGLGWQFKNSKIQYDYTYSKRNDGNPDAFGRFDRVRTTMGPVGVAGIEYSHFSLPISAFMELEYFSDIMADPGWTRLQGGVGLRYIF
jgi:hypothetical protein